MCYWRNNKTIGLYVHNLCVSRDTSVLNILKNVTLCISQITAFGFHQKKDKMSHRTIYNLIVNNLYKRGFLSSSKFQNKSNSSFSL